MLELDKETQFTYIYTQYRHIVPDNLLLYEVNRSRQVVLTLPFRSMTKI